MPPFAETRGRIDPRITLYSHRHRAAVPPEPAFFLRGAGAWTVGVGAGNAEQSVQIPSRQVGDNLIVFAQYYGTVTQVNEAANWTAIVGLNFAGGTSNYKMFRRIATNDANDAFTIPANTIFYAAQMACFKSPSTIVANTGGAQVEDSGTFDHLEYFLAPSAGATAPIVQIMSCAGVRTSIADAGAATIDGVPSPYTEIGKIAVNGDTGGVNRGYIHAAWGFDYQESAVVPIAGNEIPITPTISRARRGVVFRHNLP